MPTQKYTYSNLPTASGVDARALLGINDNGQAVGFENVNGQTHGILVDHGTVIDFSDGDLTIYASGINNAGTIVGFAVDESTSIPGVGHPEYGFIFKNGHVSTINIKGVSEVEANAVSNSGEVVGDYTDASGVRHAFTDINGKVSTINVPGASDALAFGVNAHGTVVGEATVNGVVSGFISDGKTTALFNYPGAGQTSLDAINDKGQILGHYADAGGNHPFIFQQGGPFIYPSLPKNVSGLTLYGINNSDVLVGYDYSTQGVQTAIIGTPKGAAASTLDATNPNNAPAASLMLSSFGTSLNHQLVALNT